MLKWWHIKLSEQNEFIPIKHTKEYIEWYKALKAGIIGLPTVQLYNKSEHFQSKTCSTQSKTDQKISIIPFNPGQQQQRKKMENKKKISIE